MKEQLSLCFRCEHRARFHETGARPRMECGDIETGVISCYMYKPVAPLVTQASAGDTRPPYGPAMISARIEPVRVAEGDYGAIVEGEEITVFWKPEATE